MILEFLPEASAELCAAAEYYEQKEEGLGWRFRNEVLQVCQLIVQQPVLWDRAVQCLSDRRSRLDLPLAIQRCRHR